MTDALERLVILDLVPTSCRLIVNVAQDKSEQLVLIRELKLVRHETVKLSTDEDFKKIDGGFRLIDTGIEPPKDNQPISSLCTTVKRNPPSTMTTPAISWTPQFLRGNLMPHSKPLSRDAYLQGFQFTLQA
jgi:hypothetical protein